MHARFHQREVALGNAGAGDDELGPVEVLGDRRRQWRLHELHAHVGEPFDAGAVLGRARPRRVLDHRHVIAAGRELTGNGFAGDAHTDHEHPSQSITPGRRMKSA